MKIFNSKIIFASLIIMFLTGCISTKSQIFTVGEPDYLMQINLPNVINMEGLKFNLRYQNNFMAEYYLENEKDYQWTKLVSVGFMPNKTIQAYEIGLRNSIPDTTKYSIEYISPNEFKYYTISRPIKNDSNFNLYEVNLGYAKNINCGFIMLHYAKNFSANEKESNLVKYINNKMPIFLSSIPDIKCK
ncbi:hypothetical protein [Campylobacter pinnipediorum]|uniref:hypothetical protein n=1 Tax=Campylobacter pinnipediorum TaxID=1965231 RepID=UPI00084D3020|nr:hypothetical protein [Campylobacter pinnipediorum]